MDKGKSNIALFIDVDNANISDANFVEIIEILESRGRIAYGKVYGFSERKNKGIINKINSLGFDITSTMRLKTRGKSALDNRMVVDIIKHSTGRSCDIYCIIAGDGDLVPTYSALKADGRWIIDLQNSIHEKNERLVDERIQLASEYTDPAAKRTAVAAPRASSARTPVAPKSKAASASKKAAVVTDDEDDEDEELDDEFEPIPQRGQPTPEKKATANSAPVTPEEPVAQKQPAPVKKTVGFGEDEDWDEEPEVAASTVEEDNLNFTLGASFDDGEEKTPKAPVKEAPKGAAAIEPEFGDLDLDFDQLVAKFTFDDEEPKPKPEKPVSETNAVAPVSKKAVNTEDAEEEFNFDLGATFDEKESTKESTDDKVKKNDVNESTEDDEEVASFTFDIDDGDEKSSTDEDNYIFDTEYDSAEVLGKMMELVQIAAQMNFDAPGEATEEKQKLYSAIKIVMGYKDEFLANNTGNDAAVEMFERLESFAEIIATQLEL